MIRRILTNMVGVAGFWAFCAWLGGCNLSTSDVVENPISGATARVTFLLSAEEDPAAKQQGAGIAEGVAQAWVEIDELKVHMAGGSWVVASEETVSVDLLDLATYAAELGFANIPAGKITQIRLHVVEGSSSYVVTNSGEEIPMEVPSGMKSGIKLIGKWDIGPCTENVIGLVLSDHHNAIHVHPTEQGTRYVFRPVIKVGEILVEEGECDPDDSLVDDSDDSDSGDDQPGDDEPGDDDENGEDDEPGDDEPPI